MKIMILTDGKMGDLVQCRGVADALTDKEQISEYVVSPGFLYALPLPYMPVPSAEREEKAGSPYNAPLPEIVIASGRRTLPYLRHFKRDSNPPFTVFLKDPRFHRNEVDLIWAPTHDGLSGDNVFATPTSPHTITEERLTDAASSAAKRFSEYSSPSIGVILGGNSKSVTWDDNLTLEFAAALSRLPTDHSILITASRRTPDLLLSAVKTALTYHNTWIWDGVGDNPYHEILAHCDKLIVTGDSHNMVSEALAAGKPVYVYRPPGVQKKLGHFLDQLESHSAIVDLSAGVTGDVAVQAIDTTPLIAAEILRRYQSTQ